MFNPLYKYRDVINAGSLTTGVDTGSNTIGLNNKIKRIICW